LGQKVHPTIFRVTVTKDWRSKWFSKKHYSQFLHEDLRIKKLIKEKVGHAGVSKIVIERTEDRARIFIYTARPGVIIGRKGTERERLKKEIQKITDKDVFIGIREIRKAELDSQLVAENIALQLEKRIPFRRAMKKSVAAAIRFGAYGIKICCSGRLAGAEMARHEWNREGRIPLHTIKANIDYGFAISHTTYGTIGVKVWIFKGDVVKTDEKRDVGEDVNA
jgi:small subunit ribosomal protein S3